MEVYRYVSLVYVAVHTFETESSVYFLYQSKWNVFDTRPKCPNCCVWYPTKVFKLLASTPVEQKARRRSTGTDAVSNVLTRSLSSHPVARNNTYISLRKTSLNRVSHLLIASLAIGLLAGDKSDRLSESSDCSRWNWRSLAHRVCFINLLRSNDVPRTSRIFSPKVAIFSQFWVYLNVTQVKQMTNLLLLSNCCPVISFWQIQNDILTNYCIYTVWSLVMVRGPIASARG